MTDLCSKGRMIWALPARVAVLTIMVAWGCSGARVGVEESPAASGYDEAFQPTGSGEAEQANEPSIERVGDLAIITLRGSPAQRGAAVGRLFREEIRTKTSPYVRDYLSQLLGGVENAFRQAKTLEPAVPEGAREEMRALADAAGVGYEEILLFNVFSDILTTSCTTAVVSGEASLGQVVRFARNVDLPMPPQMQPPAFLAIVHPEGGLPWAGYTFPGMVGPPTSVNARGVAVSIHGTAATPASGTCLPIAFSTSAALARAESARSFIEQLEAVDHCGGFIITAADGTEGLSLEITPTRTERLAATGGLLVLTNHFQTESMIPLQPRVSEESARRFEIVRAALSNAGGDGADTSDLREVLMREQVLKPFTLMSVVVEPAGLVIWLWQRGTPPGDFIEVAVGPRLEAD